MADDVHHESVSRSSGAFGSTATPPPFEGDRGAGPPKEAGGFWDAAGDALRTGLGQAGSWSGV
jgi:hypothetical protein